ncbi:putative N-acetylmuramoyl-L-alanine amidase [Calothrix sp. NIES-4101]|nr:putative N-acetylmuramoyl-L-alanine amidase [Calothrix sp. NIES-4101]
MRLGIDIGHNCPPDTGASGFGNEDKMNKAVGEHLIAMLIKAGVDVVDCRSPNADSVDFSLWKRTAIANTNGCDFYVSIHHNAGGGAGSEVFAVSDAGRVVAKAVLNKLCGLGFKNRGVKFRKFFVLMRTLMPAILIECCFVDRQSDVDLWNQIGAEAIAKAIFDGLRESLKF